MGIAVTFGCRAKATVRGVDRDPGEITTVDSPSCTNVSASTEAHKVLVFVKSSIHHIDSVFPMCQISSTLDARKGFLQMVLDFRHGNG